MNLPWFVFLDARPNPPRFSLISFASDRFKKRVLIQQLETALAEVEARHAASSQLPNDHGS